MFFIVTLSLYFISLIFLYVKEHGFDVLIIKILLIGIGLSLIFIYLIYKINSELKHRIDWLTKIATSIKREYPKIEDEISDEDSFNSIQFSINSMIDHVKSESKIKEHADKLEQEGLDREKELEKGMSKLERIQVAITNLLEDLTESKKEIEKKVEERTEELSQEKSKLDQITENMTIGAILLNPQGQVLFVNNEARKILNLRGDGKNNALKKLAENFDEKKINENIVECVSGTPVDIPEIETGEYIYEILFRCLHDKNKGIFGHLIWIRDITEEKLLDRSKSELVAVASHQLKTPLTVTRGNTEMLLDGSLGKLNKEQTSVIRQTAEANKKLITLVNEMLDITRIEKNRLQMNVVDINIDQILGGVIDNLKEYIERHNIKVCYEKIEGAIPAVKGDKMRAQQIFQNLIENAIQYSRFSNKNDCSVDINLSVKEGSVEVSVKDSGIGIPVREQGKIFERFYRATNAVKFASSGTGLGLYIAKSILKELGGDIRFESEQDVGTTFFVTFPISKK